MRLRDERAFTLIEVLAAVLIVSLVFGLLLESVTRTLADLGRARQEARAAALAELRVRELEAELAAGTPLEDGVQDGSFDAPDDDLRWRVSVSPFSLPLPPDYPNERPPSPLFTAPNARPAPLQPGQEPPLRVIEVRVFPVDEPEPEAIEPTVLLVTSPPDPARLQQLQSQNAQEAAQPPPEEAH
jgi:prepilin-type N-terminal cleavage/methylation domain-containing protein